MPEIAVPIATHFLTGSILTLVHASGRADRGRGRGTTCCGVAARANVERVGHAGLPTIRRGPVWR